MSSQVAFSSRLKRNRQKNKGVTINNRTVQDDSIADFNECMAMMKLLMRAVVSLIFLVNILPQTAKAIESRDNFMLVLDVLSTADISQSLALVKTLALWRRQLVVKTLLVQMCEDWESASIEELRKMRFYARVSKLILRFLIFTALIAMIIFDVLYLETLNANTVWVNGTAYRPLYFLSYFPFETHESPVFEIISAGQCIAGNMSVVSFIAYDIMYVFSVLHFSGQLCNVKRRMRNLVEEHRLSGVSFARCIKSVIQRQLNHVSYAHLLEESFNKTFLVQVFTLSIMLCFQGYQIVKLTTETNTEPALLIFTILFTLSNLNSIFVYCAMAQVIRDESLSLFDEIYQMQWYELPPKDALMIVIVISRCARPIELTVGKFMPLTLEYFARFVKAIAGYMSVLLAVKDKFMGQQDDTV